MRLRLTVQRNGLPAANILWNVAETNSSQAYTITRLLEDVNHIIPLEAEHWGLEHYVVEVGGFECLHFTPVAQALKEDDHVSIRPLMTAEVRARTLTGRHQISDAGQHLVDGVPFGRPYLRHPRRPAVHIPPRERQRLDDIEANADAGSNGDDIADLMRQIMGPPPTSERRRSGGPDTLTRSDVEDIADLMRETASEEQERENIAARFLINPGREETDAMIRAIAATATASDLQKLKEAMAHPDIKGDPKACAALEPLIQEMEKCLGQPSQLAIENKPSVSRSNPPRRGSKTVQFKEPVDEPSDDSEDDEDFAPEEDSDEDVSMDDEPDNDSSSGESESDSGNSSSASNSSDSTSDSDSDSDSDTDSDASSPPDVLSSKDGSKKKSTTTTVELPALGPPGGGLSKTKQRNARRTRCNRLRHLKEAGELHRDATLADLQKYEDEKSGVSQVSISATPFSNASGKRKRLDDEEATENNGEGSTELEQRKQELMARIGESSSSTVQATESENQQMLKERLAEPSTPQVSEPEQEQTLQKETPTRRMRPDVGAISRILTRQAARPAAKKIKTKPTAEEPQEPEGASDPDFWKTRINLSAFECWDEDYELSTPPFPFKQHWDPASKAMREKANKKKQKREKMDYPRDPSPIEEDEEEDKIILDYDDTPATENPDAEISAAIEDQLRQDVATAAQTDLPSLPEDVSTLPNLASSDIKEGAVIVCKFFAVNPITITPEISDYKTAIVEKEGDSGNGAGTIQLRIAQRDLPKREKKFDGKGNRIYEAADAFLMEDEEADEGLWEGQFAELLEAKLLKAA